jgi:hypothetical protein
MSQHPRYPQNDVFPAGLVELLGVVSLMDAAAFTAGGVDDAVPPASSTQ